jgi:glycosyltransferase involved in cell wall biosynthesis
MALEVGVVIPCFNHSEYLPEALESIAYQTRDVARVVVVDDASDIPVSDNVPHRYPYYLISHEVNLGPSASRNHGIGALVEYGCDYIVPLDADDILEPEFVEDSLAAIEKHSVDMAYPDYIFFGDYRGIHKAHKLTPIEVSATMRKRNVMVNTSMYKADVFRAVRDKNGYGYDPELHKEEHYGWEDWMFFLEATLLGFRAAPIHKMLFRYRIKKNGNVEKANRNSTQLWAYFKKKIKALYDVELGDMEWLGSISGRDGT